MANNDLFETEKNKALIAICTRKLISNVGIGAIVWGVLNSSMGVFSMQANMVNVGLVILGLLMFGSGVRAMTKPSLGVLGAEAIIAMLLFAWNLVITSLNSQVTGEVDPRGLIFPLVIAGVFSNYYRKLGHLREQIESVDPEMVKTTKRFCKELVKKKLKNEPYILETTNRKCRTQLMEDSAFFIQRDMMRAFVGSREDVRQAIADADAKSLKLHFHHPVGKLKYVFNRKSSDKLKEWLSHGMDSMAPDAIAG